MIYVTARTVELGVVLRATVQRSGAENEAVDGAFQWAGSRSERVGFSWIFRSDDGRLSLSRCQTAAWTLAVAWVVTTFGFILRTTLEWSWQVAALLGLSLGTGMVSYGKEVSTMLSDFPSAPHDWALIDLISEDGRPSLGRVQMLIWTVVSLVLFVSKSVLQAEMWEVPVELVVLMGLSQAGYLIPKWIKPAPPSAATPPDSPQSAVSASSRDR